MSQSILSGILLPLAGTSLGASFVFFSRRGKNVSESFPRALSAFCAGVMLASSVWSLIIPSVEMSEGLGFFSFVPAVIGLFAGTVFIMTCEGLLSDVPSRHVLGIPRSRLVYFFAVVLHNIPEGMAVGAALGAALGASGREPSRGALAAALVLSAGIAIQNIPEGTIISMPLRHSGMGRIKAFLYGAASGAVEPVAAVITMIFASRAVGVLAYLLSFAAGAMIYVTASDLLVTAFSGKKTKSVPMLLFVLGFCIMMTLDIVA